MAKVIATGRRTDNKYARLIVSDDTNVIYNNSDATKYRSYSGSVKAYNSAFWHRSSNTQYVMTLLLDKSDTLKYQISDDNTNWSDAISTQFTTLYNNVYTNQTVTTSDGYYITLPALNNWVSLSSDIPIFETGSEYNDYMSNVYIAYDWQPVSSITGKLGTFNLSTIKEESINGGNPVSGASASAFDSLESSTKLSTLADGHSVETPVIYTDSINYMSIKDTGSSTCELKFYLNGNCIYTLSQISTDAYLSMLVDEEQEVARTSIIYESSSTYSYNQEEPTETEMANLYKWLTANNQMDEFDGFVETEENWEWVEASSTRKGDKDSIRFTEEVIITKVT